MAGRPAKFTAKVREAYLELLEGGMTRTAAAGECCVSYDTVRRAMEDSAEFCVAVEVAESKAEASMIRAALEGRGGKVPKGDAWRWLEKRKRSDWGNAQQVTVEGDHTVRVEVVRVDQ